MAITPVNMTRVSHNLRTMSVLDSLRRNTLDLFLQQQRLATGRRLNTISDDPLSAGRAIDLSELLEQQNKLLETVGLASNFLSATDSAGNEISDLLLQAKSLAMANVETLVDQAERDAAAALISGIIDQLVAVGNRQFIDMFLFGGRRTTEPPFTRAQGGVIYDGDVRELSARVDAFGQDSFSVTGRDFFGALSGEVRGFVDLDPNLSLSTRLVDVNGANGLGVRLGAIEIEEQGGVGTFRVDLSAADTIGDVIDAINDTYRGAGGSGALASLNAAGNGLALTSGAGSLAVRDLGAGKTASDLGILQDPPASSTLVGGDLDPKVTLTTPVALLNGGAGLTLTDPILITNGGLSETIDLSGARTVEDILNAINAANVAVRAEINADADGINVLNRMSGTQMRIAESGGTTATQLGIRSLHAGTLLSDLNNGRGVDIVEGRADLRITAKDGSTYDVNLDGARTLQDVIDAINAATGGAVVASLAAAGNGIRLVDTTGAKAADLSVSRPPDSPSFAADDLGLSKSVPVPASELVGDDVNGIEADGIFNALIKLEAALRAGDQAAIIEAGGRLDELIAEVNERRGIVGARAAAMEARLRHTEDAILLTQTTLSELTDLDYTEAITRFQQIQTAFQANLLTSSQLLNVSLLDFLR